MLPLHNSNSQHYPFLLESVASGTAQSRYDILFCDPQQCLLLSGEGRLFLDERPLAGIDFLDAFEQQWREAARGQSSDISLPFYGGWFVYLGYELAAQIEPSLTLHSDPKLPIAMAVRIPAAIIRDHEQRCLYFVADDEAQQRFSHYESQLDRVSGVDDTTVDFDSIEEDPAERFIDGVNRIKRYIYEGDIFQVNLSRGWRATSSKPLNPTRLYQRLRKSNPAPFSAIACIGAQTIVSSSPERLVEVRDRWVQTRPIAGTRPRSSSTFHDQALASELMENIKERAEHIMLIDLERNDLGRICLPGTIEVNELMGRESYAHVHHIVSNVRGKLKGGITPAAVIRAVFPGGTITGCPKVRCMEIIDELEGVARGAYTGSIGYVNHSGDMDLNILIRTLIADDHSVNFRAGGGIVADSVAEREIEETRSKAKGLLLALQSRDG